MPPDRAAARAAWFDTKLAAWTLRSREDIRRRQAKLWARMTPTIAATPAVSHLAGRPLAEFPMTTPQEVRRDFDRWNTLGLTRAEALAAAQANEASGDGEVAPGVSAGFSSGSEGERGVFLASPAERARYIGQILAKLLPVGDLLRSWRIALCLRADSRLYRDVGGASGMKFRFFGLDEAPERRLEALKAFAPDILIAPSHVLAELAGFAERRGLEGFRAPSLKRLFCGAEPMGAGEARWITEALGVRPDPIYQATEGFLGAPCALGTLHLNEDALISELEAVPDTTRFRLIVTDLFRTSQPTLRLRLDDLIELQPEPCRCGSPLRAIKPIEGRAGDLWRWGERVICPREVEAAMETALGPHAEWRAVGSATGVRIEIAHGDDRARAKAALQDLLGSPNIKVTLGHWSDMPVEMKRRCVRWEP